MDETTPQLMIDQETTRNNAGRMVAAMIPVHLCHRLIATQPQQAMLNDDPHAGKGGVVLDIGLRPWPRS